MALCRQNAPRLARERRVEDPMRAGDTSYETNVRAAALEIIAEERATRPREDDYRSSGPTAETSSSFASFDDDGVSTTTLSDEDRAHAKILMRDLPRVLRELESGTASDARALAETRRDVADEDWLSAVSAHAETSRLDDEEENDDTDPVSALERLGALEAELREILGDGIVDRALETVNSPSREPEVVPQSTSAPISPPRPRAKLSLMPTPLSKGDRAESFEPPMPSAKKSVEKEKSEWDPYAAFIGMKGKRAPDASEPRARETSAPTERPMRFPLDVSLTHTETLRMMNDLEQRVKEKPTVSSRLRRTEATIEDIAAADERDESRFSREYTRQDAETIIKLARDVGPTGLCVDPEEEPGSREGPIAPTAPPVTPMTDHEATVSEMKSGPDSVRWIAPMAGVESIAEFKQMMDSIFAEDE